MTVIITDSTSYLKSDLCENFNIKKVSLHVIFPDASFRELDIQSEEFYRMIEEKGIPRSSQPSPQEIYEEMKRAVQNSESVVGVFISSKMSGTYESALEAKRMILEEHPDAQIEVIDSGSNSMQLGLAAIEGARAAKDGKTFEDVVNAVKECIRRTRFLFVPENLDYLIKGGRIGGARALVASILKIVPILTVEDGVVAVAGKVRTLKKAIEEMFEIMKSDHERYNILEVIVHHINVPEKAAELADQVIERFGIQPEIVGIGPVVGLHVGPGAVGFVYRTEAPLRD
jgi:DegV family protein with EDD domain